MDEIQSCMALSLVLLYTTFSLVKEKGSREDAYLNGQVTACTPVNRQIKI